MFRPNVRASVSHLEGSNIYGKRMYSAWSNVWTGIVKLEKSASKTSVRTDSSGSRGSAQEILADARLLFPVNVVLKPGDRVRVMGVELTVESVFPRHNVLGIHDHWQVDCNIYGGE